MSSEVEFARASLHKAEKEDAHKLEMRRDLLLRVSTGLATDRPDREIERVRKRHERSERLQRSLERALEEWRAHRDEVLKRLEHLQRKT